MKSLDLKGAKSVNNLCLTLLHTEISVRHLTSLACQIWVNLWGLTFVLMSQDDAHWFVGVGGPPEMFMGRCGLRKIMGWWVNPPPQKKQKNLISCDTFVNYNMVVLINFYLHFFDFFQIFLNVTAPRTHTPGLTESLLFNNVFYKDRVPLRDLRNGYHYINSVLIPNTTHQ